LLEWLGALSSTVVLLTATLPARKRAQLLVAYARGAGLDAESVPDVPYPRIVALSPAESAAVTIESERSARCQIELLEGEGPQRPLGPAASAAIAQAVKMGGCVAVVMNTVARAQAAYRELSGLIEPRRRRLLHARFRFRERDRLEREAIEWFGPPGSSSRPAGAVLVATQVIEQSLDIDFDLLVSDLAPIDLLLQRRGRLHRHVREHPPQLASPRMLVLASERDGAPLFDPGSCAVYAEHMLLRTWLALRQHGGTLSTPRDVEKLIERVYGSAEPPADPRLRTIWKRTLTELERELEADARRARAVRIPAPGDAEPFYERPFTGARDEESSADLRAATRLGQSVSAVILKPEERALAEQPVSPASVRALLERSVTFGSPRFAHTLRGLKPPSGWQRNALLYEHRLIELDEAGQWYAPSEVARALGIRLDPELGVVELPT
jgi:CRISPR-associated endonuclease/helicase Cas3